MDKIKERVFPNKSEMVGSYFICDQYSQVNEILKGLSHDGKGQKVGMRDHIIRLNAGKIIILGDFHSVNKEEYFYIKDIDNSIIDGVLRLITEEILIDQKPSGHIHVTISPYVNKLIYRDEEVDIAYRKKSKTLLRQVIKTSLSKKVEPGVFIHDGILQSRTTLPLVIINEDFTQRDAGPHNSVLVLHKGIQYIKYPNGKLFRLKDLDKSYVF